MFRNIFAHEKSLTTKAFKRSKKYIYTDQTNPQVKPALHALRLQDKYIVSAALLIFKVYVKFTF